MAYDPIDVFPGIQQAVEMLRDTCGADAMQES